MQSNGPDGTACGRFQTEAKRILTGWPISDRMDPLLQRVAYFGPRPSADLPVAALSGQHVRLTPAVAAQVILAPSERFELLHRIL